MLADRLAALGPTDELPAWDRLRQEEENLLDQARELPAAQLSILGELVCEQWDELPRDDRAALAATICGRVVEIDDPLTFASALDRAAAIALSGDPDLALSLGEAVLQQVRKHVEGHDGGSPELSAVRARFCLNACCDLVCADRVSPYALMALLDELRRKLPSELAPTAARVAGRLAERKEEPLYRAVMECASTHRDALADASIELGHSELRAALASDDFAVANELLSRAQQHYRDAEAADEFRPDARAFEAAVDLVVAFAAGGRPEALEEPAERLSRSAAELALYAEPESSPSRPLAHTAGWLLLAARVRGAAEVLDDRGLLDLRAALLSLLDLYADARLRVVGADFPGLEVVIGPRIEEWLREHTLSRAALAELCDELPADSDVRRAAVALLEVTSDDAGKVRRFRSRPGSPGGWALVS